MKGRMMVDEPIRIVAAIVTDAKGRVLLVRKRGTLAFMQPGGKIEPGEDMLAALERELTEELGCSIKPTTANHAGRFVAPAANEAGRMVDAELYRVALDGEPAPAAEIAEMLWLDPRSTRSVELAPLTRDHVLPLA